MENPPYLVMETPGFSPKDLEKAQELGRATSLFYSAGRAVTWFHSVIHPLHTKPSVFFTNFAQFLKAKHNTQDTAEAVFAHKEIEDLQIQFVSQQYKEKHLEKLLPVALDSIHLNGAFSRAYADGLTSIVALTYHPDDIFSPYIQDLNFFCQNARRTPTKVEVYPGKKGATWKFLK